MQWAYDRDIQQVRAKAIKAKNYLLYVDYDFNGILTKRCYKAITLISTMDTQWKYVSGMSSFKVGLDYNILYKIAKMKNIKISQKIFRLIQIIEYEIMRKEREYEQSDT